MVHESTLDNGLTVLVQEVHVHRLEALVPEIAEQVRRLGILDPGLHRVDVVGMRELRGRPGERSIAIVAASEAVRRLSDLMGWDTDPGVAW